jgi:hypothetical protein
MNAVSAPKLVGDGKPAARKRHIKKQLSIPYNAIVHIESAGTIKDLSTKEGRGLQDHNTAVQKSLDRHPVRI